MRDRDRKGRPEPLCAHCADDPYFNHHYHCYATSKPALAPLTPWLLPDVTHVKPIARPQV
ncbi:hypothetical protein PM082_024472 [Marasmius tenuissimus]|nr:hypothetical protein PM082_024472 [Marasmius tenuissimus]